MTTELQSWADVHALNLDLQQLVKDQREAIRNYAGTLTAIREALGAVEDANLVECAGRLRAFALAACAWHRAETDWTESENSKAPALLDLLRADIEALEEMEHGKSDVL